MFSKHKLHSRSRASRRRQLRRTWNIEQLESRALLAAVTSVQTSGLGITSGTGNLNAEDVATLTVNFDANVVVNRASGSPTLTLNTGAKAYYTGGTGTAALTFQYIVAPGQNTSDLTVTAMSLNGSTIQTGGVNATLTGAVTNPSGTLVVDTIAPTATITRVGATSQSTNSNLQYSVVFSEAVTGVSTSSFSLTTSGVTGSGISSVVQGANAATYTVNVASGGGVGSVGLNLIGAAIKDAASNGLGGGALTLGTVYTSSEENNTTLSADMNGDGKLDLVGASVNAKTISVMLGNGAGGFTSKSSITLAFGFSVAAIADMNADGKLDVVATSSSALTVFYGDGNGAINANVVTVGASGYASAVVGDFNLDGRLDIAALTGTSVLMFLGTATGTSFTAGTTLTVPASMAIVKSGDVNNDGIPDLMVTGVVNATSLNTYRGNGNGTFQTAVVSTALTSNQSGISLNDFNNDGKLDVAASPNSNFFTGKVLLGNGAGAFANPNSFSVNSDTIRIATGDLNGDRNVDVITITQISGGLNYSLGTGTGAFGSTTFFGINASGNGLPNSLALGDFTGDGRLEAFVATSGKLVPMVNNAVAQFGPVFTITNQTPTALNLTGNTVREEQSTGALVGTLSTTDADPNDVFTYSLVSGTGSTDNASFKIAGNQLQTNAIFDFETKSSYSVRVRSTDSGGLTIESAFTITVLDELESNSPGLIQTIAPASTLSDSIGANFGRSVAISGDYYVVGAPEVNASGSFAVGQAFLYSALTGQLVRTFNNPNIGDLDQMGMPVAISGNTVVVGATTDKVGTVMAGRAMIFDALTGAVVTLNNPTPADSDFFGEAVATGGGLVAIGASSDDVNSVSNVGVVHIFTAAGIFQRTLSNPSPTTGGRFGVSVAMEGTMLVVGAINGNGQGQVHIFNASTGVLVRTINNPTSATIDSFGSSVAISGTRVAVGAPNALVGTVRAGNVRVFDLNTGNLLQTYTAPTSAAGDNFGASISIDSQSLAVGAPQTDIDGISNVGAAYLFDLSTGALRGGMSNPLPSSDDQFGMSVAMLGVKTIVGAPFEDVAGTDQGNAYVFSRVSPFSVSLSSSSLAENNPVGAVIGTLSATSGATSPVTYALVSGTGGGDNSSFTLSGNQLKAAASFNFEAKSSYSALIEATDAVGLKTRLIASVSIQDVNEAPTGLALSSTRIDELKAVGTVIGTLSTIDPDSNPNFTYTLTSGAFTDNAFFQIAGTQLLSNQAFDFESRNQYQIEVRSQDAGGLTTTKVFTIDVNNVNPPVFEIQPQYDLRIVTDINNTVQDSNPNFAVELNGFTYFTATSLTSGRELYRLNALTGTTEMVTDLLWGTSDANPQSLVVLGSSLYFTASYSYLDPNAPPGGSPETRYGIWKSDGTAAGTVLMSQIQNLVNPAFSPKPGFVANNRAVFFVGNESDGEQLWSTDGTPAGTVLARIFTSQFGPIASSFPAVVAGGLLYFNRGVDTNFGSHSLWRTDGTVAGTVELRTASSAVPVGFSNPFDPSLVAIGSTVYFASTDAANGLELWKTTGSVAATQRVTNINAGSGDAAPNAMIAFGGSVYFSANDGSHNRELWKTNGTTTSMVKDLNPTAFGDGLFVQSEKFAVFGGLLYFVGDDGSGSQLYRTDGTATGTVPFTSDGTTPFVPDMLIPLPTRMLIVNSFFGTLANQLWSTDGTQAGNQFLVTYQNIGAQAVVGNQAFLGLSDATHGFELWVTDGLAAGTQFLKDIQPGLASGLGSIYSSQGRAVFTANDGVHGNELGISDGTVAGTVLIDVARGTPPSSITQVAQLGSSLYIATKQGLYVTQLGSSSSTLLTSKEVTDLTAVGSKMFFVATATSDSGNRELWVSNGTAAGTQLVYDIRTGTAGSNPEQLTSFNNLLYFVANDGSHGKELWRSGGAPNDPLNTRLYFEFGTGSADGNIERLEVVGNKLYVLAGGKLYIENNSNSFTLLANGASSLMPWDGIVYFAGFASDTGTELWRTDGTIAGTYLVKDIVPGAGSSFPGGGVVANEDPQASRRATTEARLVFRALDAAGASQLFATTGTTAGTLALTNAPLVQSGFGLVPFNLATVGNQVYFQGYDAATGLELWTSDGTVEGTHLVKDLRPGVDPDPMNNSPGYSYSFNNLNELTAFRDRLFFSADSIASGRELWVSDGSETGSYQAIDIRGGSPSGTPKRLFVIGNSLYMTADTDEYGIGVLGSGELFKLNEGPYLQSQSTVTSANTPIQFRLDGVDRDGDPLSYVIDSEPSGGTLVINGNIATYTPDNGFVDLDGFSIIAFDGSLYSDVADFEVLVSTDPVSVSFLPDSIVLDEASQAYVADVVLSGPLGDYTEIAYTYGFGDSENSELISFGAGETTAQIVIPITDDDIYSATNRQLEVTLKPSRDVALGPITQMVKSIQENDLLPKIQFVDATRIYSEADGTIAIDVALSNPSDAPVSATITLGGNVTDAVYSLSNPITFLPGQMLKHVLVRLVDDSIAEPTKFISAGISSVSGATVTPDPNHFRSIAYVADNDTSTISVSPAVLLVAEGDVLTLTAVRTGGNMNSVLDVPLTKTFGNASAADYSQSAANFHFAAGQTQATIQLTITDDVLVEGFERLFLSLGTSASYVFGDNSAVDLSINDNDSTYVSVSLASDSLVLGSKSDVVEQNGTLKVIARLTQPSITTITVPVQISNSTRQGYAKAGADFNFSTADFVFLPGVTSIERVLTIIDDTVSEQTEKLTISLAPSDPLLRSRDSDLTTALTILDSDYTLAVTPVKKTVKENEGTAQFVVSLNTVPTVTTTVNLELATTMARSEYVAAGFNNKLAQAFTFAAGDPASKTISIGLVDDTVFDGADTLSLSAYFFNKPKATATIDIADNESKPTLKASKSGLSLADNGGPIHVQFTIDTPVSSKVALPFKLTGSAKQGEDYLVTSGTMAILTDTLIDIEFQPFDNQKVDGDKTVQVTIFPPQAGDIAITIPAGGVSSSIVIKDHSSPPASKENSQPSAQAEKLALELNRQDNLDYPSDAELKAKTAGISGGDVDAVHAFDVAIVFPTNSNNGIIQGGQVFFDANFNGLVDYLDLNGNGRRDEGEPLEPVSFSDLDGAASFQIAPEFDRNRDGLIGASEGRLASIGGLDTSINLPRTLALYAPAGVYAATTVSTLLENLIRRHAVSVGSAIATVRSALQLGAVNIAGGDSLYQVLAGDAAVAFFYTRQVQLHGLVSLTAGLFGGSTGDDAQAIANQVYDYLSDRLNEGGSLDLASSSLVNQLLNTIAQRTNSQLSASDLTVLAQTISAALSQLEAIKLESFADPLSFLQATTRLKKVLVGEMVTDSRLVASGSVATAVFQSNYSGNNLLSRAGSQTIGQVIPTLMGVTDALVREGQNGTIDLEFIVQLIGDHDQPITVDYATVDGTALVSDYTPKQGTLTWVAHDVSTKTVTVSVKGDNDFEMDEFLSLVLSNGQNVVLRRPQGIGYIANDDSLTLPTATPGDFVVDHGQLNTSIISGADLVATGMLLDPLNATLVGSPTLDNQFTFNFSRDTYRADTYLAAGGSGHDILQVTSGRFQSITHVIGSSGGVTLLRSENDVQPVINWSSMDSFRYSSSVLDQFIIQVPSSVTSVVLDDPDGATTGSMRISSPTNQFAPIVFTNPATKITLVRLNPATTVTTLSTDPEFTGSVETLYGGSTPSSTNVAENQPVGTVVGLFESLNPILAGDYQIALVPGTGDTHNSLFSIDTDGKTLLAASSFDFESGNQYSIRTRTTGPLGTEVDAVFTITVTNVNEAPTNIALSSNTITENSPVGSVIASLQTTDPDAGNAFTYSFVAGTNDNAAFTIDTSGRLLTNVALNFEGKPTYTIRLRSTDQGGLSVDKTLIVQVGDLLEISQPIQIGDGTAQRSVVKQLVVTFDQSIAVDPGAFLIQQRVKAPNGSLLLNTVTSSVALSPIAGGGTRATITFSGAFTQVSTGALVDGNYQLAIDGSKIHNATTGALLDADNNGVAGGLRQLGTQAADSFFALLGDVNGNGEVDSQDLLGANNAFRSRVGQANYNAAYDINGNGQIDSQDLLAIQNNYRKRRSFF